MAGNEQELRKVRQEDEFEALKSIYSGDIVDLRKNEAWQVPRPPEMLISLRPQQSSTMGEVYARIDFHVKCTRAYPDTIPEVGLKNPQGLSDQKVKQLLQQLIQLARQRVGAEMIFELCSHIESFLHDNNNPPRPSFYDEMIIQQKRELEEKEEEDKKKKESQRQLEETELKELEIQLKKREQERKEDAKRLRKQQTIDRLSGGDMVAVAAEQSRISRASVSPLSRGFGDQNEVLRKRTQSVTSPPGEEILATTVENQVLPVEKAIMLKFRADKERRVYRGICIGSSTRGSRVFVGMDADTGALVAVTQWEIHIPSGALPQGRSNNERGKYKGQISSIETEFQSLARLSHSNLVLYLGLNQETKSNCIKINVLSEYFGCGNLETMMQSRQPLPMDRVCFYAHQILEGLAYLHSKGIVHRSLRLSSLFLNSSGVLKIADYGIHTRLVGLVHESQCQQPTDSTQLSAGLLGSKRDDVYQVGLVMLSLVLGYPVTTIPSRLPSDLLREFIDFFKLCTEEKLGCEASELLEHDLFKMPLYPSLSASSGSYCPRSRVVKKRQALSGGSDSDDVEEAVDSLLLKSVSSESRLKKEFKILKMIGSGAFGDVIKVRNILDNRCYAIKRITLKPVWHKQYKKLTREVEVLSKLNHENIVRYFNSWLETCEETSSSDDTSSLTASDDETPSLDNGDASADTSPSQSSVESVIRRKNLSNLKSPNASEPNEQVASGDENCSSSDSDDESDGADLDVFAQSNWMMSSTYDDDLVVFERSSDEKSCGPSIQAAPETKAEADCKNKTRRKHPKKQFLYIQMEFCEKSTLRDCIDKKNLYKDVNRVWELFREIIEGLAHIHDQGIIHRDLKPVNIFLDSEYHVKIGDFGLATAFLDIVAEPSGAVDLPSRRKQKLEDDETSMTGKVGTALYSSPEIESNSKRYNLKVDIYSLGIIFFEMCYRPMTTQMERIKILSNIRKESVDFPDDFSEICIPDQAEIIRLLLSHDPFKRPSAKELLKSEYLPLSQLEESELYNVLDSTISNPEGRTYKHMLHRIFAQPVQTVTDFLYDADLYKGSFTMDHALMQQTVASTLERIFRRHGAVKMTVPLLMPTSSLYNCETYVTMMERSGGLISLPYDMMVPFARFLARSRTTINFRRYSIDHVYRECRPSGVHPRQLWAASFDIVRSATGSLVDDAETIHVVSEIIKEFPALSSRGYRLRLNHAALMKAVLLHCGVPEELYLKVCAVLGDSSLDRPIQRQKLLSIEPLNEVCVGTIYSFLQKEDVYEKMASFLRCISKTKTQAAALTKKGLCEIETIISHLSVLGSTFQPLVSLSLVSNVHFFSGVIFQVMHEVKRKKKMIGVLAAGGRYDNLVAMFRKPTERQQGCPQAVGVSIAFDKVVSTAMEHGDLTPTPPTELLICTISSCKKDHLLTTAQRFWEIGVSAKVHHEFSQTMDDVKVFCHESNIPYSLTVRDEDELEWSLFRVEKDKEPRSIKKLKNLDEMAEYYQKNVSSKLETSDSNRIVLSQTQPPTDTGQGGNSAGGGGAGGGGAGGSGVVPLWNVTFVLPEGKESNRLHKNTRRAYEAQIDSGIREKTLPFLNTKNRVEVVATELSAAVLKAFAANFEPNKDEGSMVTAIGVKDGQKANNKKYVLRVISEIKDLKMKQKNSPVILYSLVDDIHRVLLC